MNRSNRSPQRLLAAAAIGLVTLAGGRPAYPFAEDTCALYTSPARDRISYRFGNCGSNNIEEGFSLAGGKYGSSDAHLSAVYLLAREAGFTDAEARTIVFYEESVDLGHWDAATLDRQPASPRDGTVTAGLQNAVTEGQTGTAGAGGDPGETGMGAGNGNIDGVVRTSVSYGGAWIHYVPWLRYAGGAAAPNALSDADYTPSYANDPDGSPFPPEEIAINQARAWAFGRAPDLCRFGLTTVVRDRLKSGAALTARDLNLSGQACASGEAVFMTVPDPTASGDSDAVTTGLYPTGWQPIVRDNPSASCDSLGVEDSGPCDPRAHLCPMDEAGARRCFDERWNQTWSESTRLKRLAIYLHLMQDRVSHEDCTRIAPLWYSAQDRLFHVDWYQAGVSPNSEQACGNQQHFAGHLEEIGQGVCMPGRTRTALEITLREMIDWLRRNNRAPRLADAAVTPLVDRVYAQLGLPAAADRLATLCNTARADLGAAFTAWYDGNAGCVFPADAGDTLPPPSSCQ